MREQQEALSALRRLEGSLPALGSAAIHGRFLLEQLHTNTANPAAFVTKPPQIDKRLASFISCRGKNNVLLLILAPHA